MVIAFLRMSDPGIFVLFRDFWCCKNSPDPTFCLQTSSGWHLHTSYRSKAEQNPGVCLENSMQMCRPGWEARLVEKEKATHRCQVLGGKALRAGGRPRAKATCCEDSSNKDSVKVPGEICRAPSHTHTHTDNISWITNIICICTSWLKRWRRAKWLRCVAGSFHGQILSLPGCLILQI